MAQAMAGDSSFEPAPFGAYEQRKIAVEARKKTRAAARRPACPRGGMRPALACGSRSTRGVRGQSDTFWLIPPGPLDPLGTEKLK